MKKYYIYLIIITILIIMSSCENDNYNMQIDLYDGILCINQPVVNDDLNAMCEFVACSCIIVSTNIEIDDIYILSEDNKRISRYVFLGANSEQHGIGGDEFHWYTAAFGRYFDFIPSYFIFEVGMDEFINWVQSFQNIQYYERTMMQSINFRTFIEHFNISLQDFIRIMEYTFGLNIYEIDMLINWGRYGNHEGLNIDEMHDAAFWSTQYTTIEIEAIFSNDIEVIWAAFPGHGIMYNGRVYSPEWILNNIEQAVFEELLPMEEIARVIELTVDFAVLDDVRASADVVFQAGLAVR